MKKFLYTLVVISMLLTVDIDASQTPISKQDMMRTASPDQSEVITMDESPVDENRSLLAVILASALIMIIVGLLSTFVTKYALSIKNKNNSIYQKKNKPPTDPK